MAFVKKPYAIRKVVTNPDGTTSIVYVDAKTNKVIANPQGYNVVEAKSTPTGYDFNTTNGNNNPVDKPTLTDVATGEKYRGERASEQAIKDSNKTASYINKPAVMGLAGFLPGVLGTVGMIANVGTNANNTAAVNQQKGVLGFAKPTTMQNLGSVVMDKKGYIGDATYQDGTGDQRVTPVSFEAEDSAGRTTLTPDEARMRNELAATPSAFEEATEAQKQNAISAYESAYGKQTGFLSSLGTAAKGLFSNLFGTPSSSTGGATGGGSSGYNSKDSYPAAPSKPSTTPTTPSNKAEYDRDGQGGVAPSVPDTPGLY